MKGNVSPVETMGESAGVTIGEDELYCERGCENKLSYGPADDSAVAVT